MDRDGDAQLQSVENRLTSSELVQSRIKQRAVFIFLGGQLAEGSTLS